MNDRVNKTSICSVLFLDIIDYSKKSDSDQIAVKIQFNDLISHSLKDVAQNDIIILDTGDGLAIAFTGSPEDAMFVSLSIRDGILKSNIIHPDPLYVRFGINLGPVRIVKDINDQPNIIGDGINVAQRIMSFSGPNQILVSRSYYEVTSRLTQEFSEMFAFSGVKHDKHVREHEIYSVRSHKDETANVLKPEPPKDERRSHRQAKSKNKPYLNYIAAIMLVIALLSLVKLVLQAEPEASSALAKQEESAKNFPQAGMENSAATENVEMNPNIANNNSAELNSVNDTKKSIEPATSVKKRTKDKADLQALSNLAGAKQEVSPKNPPQANMENSAMTENIEMNTSSTKNKSADSTPVKHTKKSTEPVASVTKQTKEKTGLQIFSDSLKQGQKNDCTQAQISMNQCH